MFMFLMLCQHMHWKVCRLTIFHFILFLQFIICTVWVYIWYIYASDQDPHANCGEEFVFFWNLMRPYIDEAKFW